MSYVLLKESEPKGPTGGSAPPSGPGPSDATGHIGYGQPSGPTATDGSVPKSLSECTRIIVSFWFRLPQTTIDKVLQAYKEWMKENRAIQNAGGYGKIPPPFNGIVPLLTFGKDTQWKNIGIKETPGTVWNYHRYQWLGEFLGCRWDDRGLDPVTPTLFQQDYDGKFDYKTSPSYIGIDVKPMFQETPDDPPPEPLPKLVFALQMQDKAETSGGTDMQLHQAAFESTDVDTYNLTVYDGMESSCQPAGHLVHFGPSNEFMYYYLEPISTASSSITVEPKLFQNDELFQTLPGPYVQGKSVGHSVSVEANHWHHILLSFDLTFPCITKGRMEASYQPKPGTIKSAPQLWIAFDGKNLVKKKLSHYWPQTGKPNDFISVFAKQIYDSVVHPYVDAPYTGDGTVHTHSVIGQKAGEFSYTFKPLDMLPVGLPSTDLYTDKIRHVEMAELQIFPGVCIDTGVLAHRQAFILNGKPVPPDQKATEGNKWHAGSIDYLNNVTMPTAPTGPTGTAPPVVIRTIAPEVLLHKTKKWQKGDNTGAGGKFEPTGQIDPYKPDPSLGGPQGDPQ